MSQRVGYPLYYQGKGLAPIQRPDYDLTWSVLVYPSTNLLIVFGTKEVILRDGSPLETYTTSAQLRYENQSSATSYKRDYAQREAIQDLIVT